MCGFAAIYSASGTVEAVAQQRLNQATQRLSHRGPDDTAFYVSHRFATGFRRLKIIDLSDSARQPMSDDSGRFWVVFNGEVYNYRELKNELQQAGWAFHTASDTEVLLKSYLQWGEDCLTKFNGMFAFLIWDQNEQSLFGARDRFGEKPLYYAQVGDRFYFASEIKAMLELLGYVPQMRRGIVRNYLEYGRTDFASNTFYEGIYSLAAAHKINIRDGRKSVSEYWKLEATESFRGDPVPAVRELFLDSLRLRVRSDVPVGTCLSGGLDSSSIVCGLSHIFAETNGQLTHKTFTAHYPEFDERREIDCINTSSKSTGYSISPRPRGLQDILALLDVLDEPFHSLMPLASMQVMSLARQNGVVVLLNGQGADELLAGYAKFLPYFIVQLLIQGHWQEAMHAASSSRWLTRRSTFQNLWGALTVGRRELTRGNKWSLRSSAGGRQRKLHKRYFLAIDFLRDADDDEVEEATASNGGVFKQKLHNSLFGSYLPLYLRVEDRLSMANSLESRLPFLDHRLAELTFSIPPRYFMKSGMNKYLLREAMVGIVPEMVRSRRQKFGFPVPGVKWVMEDMRSEVSELVHSSEFSERGLYNVEKLRMQFDRDVATRSDASLSFWFRVISMELWMQRNETLRLGCTGCYTSAVPHERISNYHVVNKAEGVVRENL